MLSIGGENRTREDGSGGGGVHLGAEVDRHLHQCLLPDHHPQHHQLQHQLLQERLLRVNRWNQSHLDARAYGFDRSGPVRSTKSSFSHDVPF